MRDRLIEKLTETFDEQYEKRMLITPQHTADSLLADGWIRPPCKVGDTLYVISHTKDKRVLPFINKYEATYIQVGKRKCKVYHEVDGYIKIFLQDDFGKTVFISREEAEAKLKEGKG